MSREKKIRKVFWATRDLDSYGTRCLWMGKKPWKASGIWGQDESAVLIMTERGMTDVLHDFELGHSVLKGIVDSLLLKDFPDIKIGECVRVFISFNILICPRKTVKRRKK